MSIYVKIIQIPPAEISQHRNPPCKNMANMKSHRGKNDNYEK